MSVKPNGTSAWVSEAEYQVSAQVHRLVARMAESDRRFSESASPRTIDRSPVARMLRAPATLVRLAATSSVGRFARKVLARAEREVWSFRHRRPAAALDRPVPTHDPRFVLVPAELSADEGNAWLAETGAEYWVFLRDGAVLVDSAVERLTAAARLSRRTDLLIGDHRDQGGRIVRNPVFSPITLREADVLGPAVAVSVDALRTRGGFRPSADGAQVLDIALDIAAENAVKAHAVIAVDRIPRGPNEAEARVVQGYLDRKGIAATVAKRGAARHVEYAVQDRPLVSVVIPTRGGVGVVGGSERVFVVEAVRELRERTNWANLEIVVVADDETSQEVIDELTAVGGSSLVLVRWTESFNFSAKMNLGAAVASGEYLLALNDDVEVITPNWLDSMLGLAQQPDVVAVGALLFFEDGSVQHAGHIYRRGGAGHVAFGITPGAAFPIERVAMTREVTGVTAACMLMKRDRFVEVGGFDVGLPGNYNDVDLNLKLRTLGGAVVCTGDARLYHFESRTRDAQVHRWEQERLHARWWERMQRDDHVPAGLA